MESFCGCAFCLPQSLSVSYLSSLTLMEETTKVWGVNMCEYLWITERTSVGGKKLLTITE